VTPAATPRRATVASKTLAEQLQPLVRIHCAMRSRGYATVDIARARERIEQGRAAFDAGAVLYTAGDLNRAFSRTAAAFERTGMESSARIEALLRTPIDVTAQTIAWSNADALPGETMTRLARKVAGIVGSAVLSRVATDILGDGAIASWKRPHCPCCAASPDLALSTDARRTLVCWRCDTRWRTEYRGCLGCGADSAPTLARVPSPYLGYELAICNACGRYLKERRGALSHDLLVERALIAGLDEAAQQRGLRA
jgi:formate dehydrogenase maturation protein FdhE